MKHFKLNILILIFVVVCLGGCSPKQMFTTAGKIGQVIWDPSTPIGGPDDQPSQVALSMYATNTVNPNPDSVLPEALEPEPVTLSFSADNQDDMREQLRIALTQLDAVDNAITQANFSSYSYYSTGTDVAQLLERHGIVRRQTFKNNNYQSPIIILPSSPVLAERGQGASSDEADRPRQVGEYASHSSVNRGTVVNTKPQALVVNPDGSLTLVDGSLNSQRLHELLYPEEQYPVQMTPEQARAIATPVIVYIIQLKDDSVFLSMDFDSLNNDLKEALGSSYISHDNYVMQPGQFKFMPEMDINKYTRFIAVYAQFYTMDGATWKGVVPIDPKGHSYNLMISMHDNVILIQHEGIQGQ